MRYELWDTERRHIVGDYETEADALAVVRDALRKDRPSAVATLFLTDEESDGKTTVIAASDERNARAETAGRDSLGRVVVADKAPSSVVR